MKLVCGMPLSPEGLHCMRDSRHEGACAALSDEYARHLSTLAPVLRTQSKRASFAEAAANTFVGFCLSWGATMLAMRLFGIHMSFHQLWYYTWFMTGVSIARGYCLRRAWNAEWWKQFKKRL